MSVFFALDVKIESRAKRVVQHIMCKKHAVLHRVLYKIFCNLVFKKITCHFIRYKFCFNYDFHLNSIKAIFVSMEITMQKPLNKSYL